MKRIRIIAGCGLDKNGVPLDREFVEDAKRRIETRAVVAFGGVTLRKHTGASQTSQDSPLIREAGLTVEVLLLVNVPLNWPLRVNAFARYVRDTLHQSAVILTVEDVAAEFI